MEPHRAAEAFESAQMFTVWTQGVQRPLYMLDEQQMAEIKSCSKRSDTLMLAKKYFKAAQAIEELEKALEAFPQGMKAALVPRSSQPYANVHKRPTSENRIVPYVPVAVTSRVAAAKRQELGYDWWNVKDWHSTFRKTRLGSWYWLTIKSIFYLLLVTPLILMLAFCAQFVLLIMYVAQHPELLFRAVRTVVGFAPVVTEYAAKRVATQLWDEVASWWN